MTDEMQKPLNWKPEPGIGYSVQRRPDGGMHYIFTDLSHATLVHWREFALQHLYDSDRLTRNLYDLRQVQLIPEEAINFATEINNDPAARNVRVAVLVADESLRSSILEIRDLTAPGGVEMGVFLGQEEAETWLDRPLTMMV